MTEAVPLTRLEQHWGIRSRMSVIGMPETGASMFRWCHVNENGMFRLGSSRRSHYLLSLVLKPMDATVWKGRQKLWDGPIGRHSVRIIHPDDENYWQSASNFDLFHIMIPRSTVARMFNRDQDDAAHLVRFNDPLYTSDEMIFQIGRQMLHILGQEGPFVKEIADGLCHALIAYMIRRYAMGVAQALEILPSRSQIRRVLDLVDDNFSREITLEEMARVAGMSVYYFSREFRKCMGKSPHRYLMTRRIEHAKKLLVDKKLSVLDVSLECGFKDASHFSRVFHAILGETPSAYRASV